ncbi:unnamed protein product, partial [marine sediment metagenome]
MDTFMCSNWYFLRYTSPKIDNAPFEAKKLKYWLPVDLYTGGAEHAVMHLLYSRFFIKAIRDIGLVDFDEPFTRLFNQGTIIYRGGKMSKSKGNVIAPDEYVAEVEEFLSIFGDPEKPLLQVLFSHLAATALAKSFPYHLFISQHCLTLRTPIDWCLSAVSQTSVIKFQEKPP